MGKLNRLIGLATRALDLDGGDKRGSQPHQAPPYPQQYPQQRPAAHDPYAPPAAGGQARATDADRAAIARYDYLMQTADPHRVEQIHREAFSRLTPAQRAQVQERMSAELGPGERPASSSADDLARAAGRTEAARPGRMRGILSRVRGAGAAGMVGGAAVGVLGVVAAGAVTSAVAAPLLEHAGNLGVDFDALAQGVDLEGIANGLGAEELTGAAEGFMGSAEGVVGSASESVSGLGETVSGWGERLGDLGIPGIGDLFRK